MLEPIGMDDKALSPYDRYLLYKQLQNQIVRGAARPDPGQQSLSDLSRGGDVRDPLSALPEAPTRTTIPGRIDMPYDSGQAANTQQPGDTTRKATPSGGAGIVHDRECQTCKNRKYQDGSDDPGVSYKNPTRIGPDQAASSVRAHEYEHVRRNQSKAQSQGREVVSQSVVIKTAICPECGRVYVSGGTTTTVTRAREKADKFQVGQVAESSGVFFNEKT